MVAPSGGRWALRRSALHSGIGMTINLPGHPMSATQHCFNHE